MSHQDYLLPDCERQSSAWRYWPQVTALLVLIGLGSVWLDKAIGQAEHDCKEYCEREIGE